jgi:hypothetical protein
MIPWRRGDAAAPNNIEPHMIRISFEPFEMPRDHWFVVASVSRLDRCSRVELWARPEIGHGPLPAPIGVSSA